MDNPKSDFPVPHKEINYIFDGRDSYESIWKHRLTAREVMSIGSATPEYLKWSKVPITFDRSNHPDYIKTMDQYTLIVSPIVMDVKLNRVLIDGGSSLSILFLKTFDQMGLPRLALQSYTTPFHGVELEPRPPLSIRSPCP
jgi:hypothetical protein